MTAEGLFVLGVIGLVTAALMSRRIGVDTAMVGGLLLLLLADQILGGDRILPIQEGLSGFSHKAVVMIGALYVVAAGLRETGGVHLIAGKLLGRPKGLLSAQLRLMIPVGLLSGLRTTLRWWRCTSPSWETGVDGFAFPLHDCSFHCPMPPSLVEL